MIISDVFSKLKLLEQSGAVSQAIRRSSFPSWLVNSPRASLIRLLSLLTPSTDLLAPPLCRAKRCRCANSVLIAGPSQERKRERERTSSRTFVCTFGSPGTFRSMNRMLLANPVGPLARRDPHYGASPDLTPHCSRDDHDRSVGPRFYPYRTPILHDTAAHLRLPPILPPLLFSLPLVAATTTPSIFRTHFRPVRLIPLVLPYLSSLSRSPFSASPSLAFSLIATSNHLLAFPLPISLSFFFPPPFSIASRAMS